MAFPALQSAFEVDVFYAAYLGWIACFFVERLIIRSARQKASKSRADRGSYRVILVSIFASVIIANSFAAARVALLPGWVFGYGILMMALGVAIRLWAVVTLRKFFAYVVQIKEDHEVVDRGPYRYVRHPAYAGSLLTIIGLGVALGSWGGVLVMLALFGFSFGYRMAVEEKALVASLGEAYVSYEKRTKRLIPLVL